MHRPKGMRVHSQSPLHVMKAVLAIDSSVSSTCQKALPMSNEVKYLAVPRLSRLSSILGSGKASLIVRSFSFRKSMQKRLDPSFLFARTTAEANGELLGRITLISIKSWICSSAILLLSGAILLIASLNGLLPASKTMSCCTTSVLPMSVFVCENNSW